MIYRILFVFKKTPVLVFSFLLLVGTWFTLGYQPLCKTVDQKKKSVITLQKQNKNLQTALLKIQKREKAKDAPQKKYERDFFEIDGPTAFLDQARKNNLESISFEFVENKEKKYYDKQIYTFSFIGEYEAILSFLDEVQFQIGPHTFLETTLVRDENAQLRLFCKICFYTHVVDHSGSKL